MNIIRLILFSVAIITLSGTISAEFQGEVDVTEPLLFEVDDELYEIELNFVDGGADFTLNSSETVYNRFETDYTSESLGLNKNDRFTAHGITLEVNSVGHGDRSEPGEWSDPAYMEFETYPEENVKRMTEDQKWQFDTDNGTKSLRLNYIDGGVSVNVNGVDTHLGDEIQRGQNRSINGLDIEIIDYGYQGQNNYMEFSTGLPENLSERCSYTVNGEIDAEEQLDPNIHIRKDGEQLASADASDFSYITEFDAECGSEVKLIYSDSGENITEKNLNLPTESWQLVENISTEVTSGFQILTDRPRVGEDLEIKMSLSSQLAEKGYYIELTGPENIRESFDQRESSFSFTPSEPGNYTVEMNPSQSVVERVFSLITGRESIQTETVEVRPNEEPWESHCRENDFNSDQASETITCIRTSIVPEYFNESVGENPEVAESLCEDLLGMSYDRNERACR